MKTKKQTELGGMLSNRVALSKVRNQLVVDKHVKQPPRKSSPKWDAVKLKFLEGAQYAKQQMANPDSKALYQSRVNETLRTPFSVAMTDYLSAPKIHEVDLSEYDGTADKAILVRTTDDFMVISVKVQIKDVAGKLIESGEATPDGKINWWKYITTAANKTVKGSTISASAFDRPGNKTVLEKVI